MENPPCRMKGIAGADRPQYPTIGGQKCCRVPRFVEARPAHGGNVVAFPLEAGRGGTTDDGRSEAAAGGDAAGGAAAVEAHPRRDELVELVLDLGRLPEARFPDRGEFLSEQAVTREDIAYVVARVGRFGKDNRAGIERTLHRISAIRNRVGDVVGLTCRVGRAVFGTVDILRDVIESGESILLLGRPGVGKTTMLREVARVLADELGKRVIVVDTSNEIAGDGDIPHPGIGRARRMQVPSPDEQHAVMIEAVENHMPQVIVDRRDRHRRPRPLAARTIAERGVQLIATAHGNTLENLLQNPTLSDLVGGIQPVTLSDEEARRRGTQKTVLERKAPPTFDVLIEIQDKDRLAVHHDVAEVVDRFLRDMPPRPELRTRTEGGASRSAAPRGPRSPRGESAGPGTADGPSGRAAAGSSGPRPPPGFPRRPSWEQRTPSPERTTCRRRRRRWCAARRCASSPTRSASRRSRRPCASSASRPTSWTTSTPPTWW